MIRPGAAAWLAGSAEVPVAPGRDQARRWAEQELSQHVYQNAKPGLTELVWKWLVKVITDFLNGLNALNGNLGMVMLLLLVLAVAGVGVWLARPRLNRRLSAAAVFDHHAPLASGQHRKLAAAAADRGDFAAAVAEQFRAVVRAAEERGVIEPQPGRTADEVMTQLIGAFASLQGQLRSAATLFDGVRYGGAATAAGNYHTLVLLDESLRAARPHYGVRATELAAPR